MMSTNQIAGVRFATPDGNQSRKEGDGGGGAPPSTLNYRLSTPLRRRASTEALAKAEGSRSQLELLFRS